MKDFENIGKRMPYTESNEYVGELLNRVTEEAIRHDSGKSRSRARVRIMIGSAAAAVMLLLVGIGIVRFQQADQSVAKNTMVQSPIDQFLNSISDEEAKTLMYYEIEEIPEY